MEWTKLFKTNHHFLKSSISTAVCDGHDDQPTSPLTVLRRSESADAPFDESPAAAVQSSLMARRVSISRSGRYKSKAKQRARLLNNGSVETPSSTTNSAFVVIFDDTRQSAPVFTSEPPAADLPSFSEHGRQPVKRQTATHQQTVADTSAMPVDQGIATSTKTPETVSGTEKPEVFARHCSYRTAAAAIDRSTELSVAENYESTDL